MNDRIVFLQGIQNLRDYGGYAARGGSQVKRGLLWRSGQHGDASEADLDAVAALSLQTIIDLRGNGEREISQCRRHPGFSGEVYLVDGETAHDGQAPHIDAARATKTADDAHQRMLEIYVSLPFRQKLIEIFRQYFSALANRKGASLVHCMAGKDRTGVAVALLHDLLGVHRDDAMADYLLTNDARQLDKLIASGNASVARMFGNGLDEAAVRTIMSVHPDYLTTSYRVITERHGSTENYMRDVLQVDGKMRAAIEAQLLA